MHFKGAQTTEKIQSKRYWQMADAFTKENQDAIII